MQNTTRVSNENQEKIVFPTDQYAMIVSSHNFIKRTK